MRELVEVLTIALHDADCPDRRCDPMVMGAYHRQAEKVLPAVLAHLRAVAADEGVRERCGDVVWREGEAESAVAQVLDAFLDALGGTKASDE